MKKQVVPVGQFLFVNCVWLVTVHTKHLWSLYSGMRSLTMQCRKNVRHIVSLIAVFFVIPASVTAASLASVSVWDTGGVPKNSSSINSLAIPRGRPTLNADRTTFVADNGQLLRGPYTSSEWGNPAPADQIANMKNLGFNAVHLYGECYDINYPALGSTAPGYAASRIDSVVAATRDAGLYLILTIGNGANNGNHNSEYVVDFWDFYAARYANETHVLFEIQNEPVAWGPPYSSPTATPPGAIDMEVAAYNAIRSHAPDTPVLLFSYAVFGGSGGANAALTDINAFNAAVGGDPAEIWSKTAVGFHGYAGWESTTEAVAMLIAAGYPCFMTEYGDGEWGTGQNGFGVMQTSELERLNVSWLAFSYIPPWGVSDNVTTPEIYRDRVDRAGLSWLPDYGNWPEQRSAYGNGGKPRATTETFVNNFLTGTLRIQAEDFDTGGLGVAYNDMDTANQGGQYRPGEAVDILIASDTGGGYAVGWTEDGEWLEYSIYVPEPGFFNLSLRVASPDSGQAVRVSCYNLDKTGTWFLPNTGDTQAWTTVSRQIFLEFGRQKLRVETMAGGFYLNWIELSPSAAAPLANGTYKLANQNSGQVIENNTSTHKILQNPWSGGNTQRWNLMHLGAGQYRVQSAQDNWYWNTWYETMTGWWGVGGRGQRFIFRSAGDGYYRIMPVDSGRSYEVENASLTGGAAIIQNKYSGLSSQKWGVLAPSASAFPTALAVEWVSSTQVDLMWTASVGAVSYNVKRSTVSGGPYSTIAANVTTTDYTDFDMFDGQVFYYVVSANTASGESLNSNQAVVTPWKSQDVGTVGVSGSTNYSDDVFTVSGSGSDIWGTTDAFRFVYLPVTGDCTIIARVASVQNADGWAKAGVMIRETLNANAKNAFIAVTPGNGVTWQYRSSTGGNSINSSTTGLSAPYWVKLVRSGNTFAGYRSPDGINWMQQGTAQTISMTGTVYLGMAVTSHNNSSLCQAVFDSVTAPGWPPPIGPVAPTKLHATAIFASQNNLGWTAAPGAASYNIKRSAAGGGPYDTIAENITTTSFCDTNVTAGVTYYYVVSANTEEGESPDSTEAIPSIVSAYLKCNETGGTIAFDATGNGYIGTLVNGPIRVAGKFGNAVDLDGTNDYVTLPAGVLNGLTDITVSAWVNLDSASTWSRVFDFGTGMSNYMFLTASNGSVVRFAIRTPSVGEQIINGTSALPTGVWTHVAVTLSGSTGILYVNGIEVGRNTAMTLTPSSLGVTTQNYIGNSQWPDPYLNGRVDEFRIYADALSADEMAALYAEQIPAAMPATPSGLSATAITDSQIDLSWNPCDGATNYNIKYALFGGGPYTLITSVSGTSFSDMGLSESTTYYYVVSAVNSVGESADSVQAAAITQAVPPAALSGLTATVGEDSVILNWNASTESGLAGYNVYRSTESDSGFRLLNESLLSSPEFTDNSVSHYTTYYYVVTAVDADSLESPFSNQVSVMPTDSRAAVLSAADFESGFGDWENISGDDSHEWTRNSGGTLTPNTGPAGGAVNSVWYVYLETSPGGANTAGNTAILQGPSVGGYNRVLTFHYHMYGAATGTLNIDVYDGTWHNGVWSLSGQQQTSNSQAYMQAIVNLAEFSGPIRIRFRAVAAGGPTGDMAIDSIEVAGRLLYGDINRDNHVDTDDLIGLAAYWLQEDCGLDLDGNCLINLYEFAEFAGNWLDS